jgi:hypothetical protein
VRCKVNLRYGGFNPQKMRNSAEFSLQRPLSLSIAFWHITVQGPMGAQTNKF